METRPQNSVLATYLYILDRINIALSLLYMKIRYNIAVNYEGRQTSIYEMIRTKDSEYDNSLRAIEWFLAPVFVTCYIDGYSLVLLIFELTRKTN